MNLLVIQLFKDGTAARSLLNYPTEAEATSALYSSMASACINPDIVSCVCDLVADNGAIYKQEVWEAVVPEE